MRIEQTLVLVLILLFASGRAHGQANTFLDATVGPQPTTGFRVSVVTPPITASFTFSPTNGAWPLTVQFVDTTQGGPGSWAWDFGDGGTATIQNPIHVFNAPSNTWTIQLTASGPGGSSVASHTLTTTNPINLVLLAAVENQADFTIGSNGKFRSILCDNGLNAVLFVYDTSGRTNYLVLTNTSRNSITFQGTQQYLTNRLLLACGEGQTGNYSSIQEYDLWTNGFGIPTNAVFVSSNAVGTAYPDAQTTRIALQVLSNGGVAALVLPYGTPIFGLGAYYRRPSDGVWTNMTSFSGIPGGGLPAPGFPAFIHAAENPVDNSVWCYYDADSGQRIFAAKYVTSSNAVQGLFLNATNIIVNNFLNPGPLGVYGEHPWIDAITDWTNSTAVILSYPSIDNSSYSFYYGNTPLVSAWSSNNFGIALINKSTNSFVNRLDKVLVGVTAPNTYTLTFMQADTNWLSKSLFPIMQQDIISGVPAATNIVDFQFGTSNYYGDSAGSAFLRHPWSHDVAYRDTNQTWRLRIKP